MSKHTEEASWLVVDTAAFIKGVRLEQFSKKIATVREVLTEVRDKQARGLLQLLPVDIQVLDPTKEDLRAVVSFAKKTGDYASLSAVDLKVLALTYMLEREVKGTVDHLRTIPASMAKRTPNRSSAAPQQANTTTHNSATPVDGLSEERTQQKEEGEETEVVPKTEQEKQPHPQPAKVLPTRSWADIANGPAKPAPERQQPVKQQSTTQTAATTQSNTDQETEAEKIKEEEPKEKTSDSSTVAETKTEEQTPTEDKPASSNSTPSSTISSGDKATPPVDYRDSQEGSSADADNDDEGGWITPDNLAEVNRKRMGTQLSKNGWGEAKVGCMTTDYAMQNVLLQMGLNLVSVDGMVIKKLKKFILRCQACYKLTNEMDKQFCPSCGNASLHKVAYTMDSNGQIHLHLKRNYQHRLRGTKYSIPQPKGGREPNKLVLREDELPRRRKKEKDPMEDPDFHFFAPRKDHLLHTGGKVVVGYGRRNPNESKKRTGKRKKKAGSLN
ncbi:20S-pre-rRNA D-site endonuclease nob1 [Balamuthia mandrillaris]